VPQLHFSFVKLLFLSKVVNAASDLLLGDWQGFFDITVRASKCSIEGRSVAYALISKARVECSNASPRCFERGCLFQILNSQKPGRAFLMIERGKARADALGLATIIVAEPV
jgi:hypothetical protein